MGVTPTVSVDAIGRLGDWAGGSCDRLGLDVPAGAWLTAPRAKAYEAAGFRYVQVAMPAREVLADAGLRTTHALALAGRDLCAIIEPALQRVILFHVHDNFGARVDAPRAGGIEPLRLDLHLAPGAGSVPWPRLAPLLARHPAPIGLEISPGQRPAPATLAVVAGELLRAGSPAPQALGA